MRAISKSILCVVISSILIASCSNQQRYYIALGDSISSGYGLATPDESHSAIFFTLLKNERYVDDYVNFAADGFTTAMLLELLHGLDGADLRVFRNARVITVNIGGNNILLPFMNYLASLRIAPGADSIRDGAGGILSGVWGVISGVGNIIQESDLNAPGIADVISGVGGMVSGARDIIIGSGEIISTSINIFSTFAGSFSPELRAELENAIEAFSEEIVAFSEEFIEIIAWLERNAPRATVIVNTVYNPIPQEVLWASLGISSATSELLEAMNGMIIQESKSRRYLVTDIHSHLSNQPNLKKFNLNPFAGNLSFDIVHPNAEGHSLIAQLNFDAFMQR